jgi:alpha-ribazole phosphatase
LARCLALAQALGYPGCPLVPALAEMDFGDWEGKKWNDIEQGALNHWMLDFVGQKPPNGENLREVFARTSHFLTHLAQQDHQKVLLITYAGPIRCIWAFLLEIRLANVFKLPVGYGEVLGFHLATDQTHCRIWQMK